MLTLLFFLLVIRFIVVPVFDWQTEKITEITANKNKLTKAEQVISRIPKIEHELAKIKLSNGALELRYFNETSLSAFKLQLQQKIERLFSQHNMKVKNFNWVAELPGDVTQERANISFEGNLKDIALLQLALANLPKLFNIGQWSFQIKKMNENSLGNVRGRMLLVAYNVIAEEKAAKPKEL